MAIALTKNCPSAANPQAYRPTVQTFRRLIGIGAVVAATIGVPAVAFAQRLELAGVPCVTPPALHCPDSGCAGQVVVSGGQVVEPKTGRTYVLDYPCNLKRGEKVTVITEELVKPTLSSRGGKIQRGG